MYIAYTCGCQTSLGCLGALRVGGTVELRDRQKPYSRLMALSTAEGIETRVVFIEPLVPGPTSPSAVPDQDEATKRGGRAASSPSPLPLQAPAYEPHPDGLGLVGRG